MHLDKIKAHPWIYFVNYFILMLSSFFISVSMGINAVNLPMTMELMGFETVIIGVILAAEIIVSFILSFFLVRFVNVLGLFWGIVISTFFRIPPLLLLPEIQEPLIWLALLMLHGVGIFLITILLQTWVYSLPTQEGKSGKMISLFGVVFSLGLALGPYFYQNAESIAIWIQQNASFFDPYLLFLKVKAPYLVSALFSIMAMIPVILAAPLVAHIEKQEVVSLIGFVKRTPGTFWAVALAGASVFGVLSFIVIYGTRNDLSIADASYLLTAFLLGSLVLEGVLGAISDYFNKRYVIVALAFVNMLIAVYLPLVIYYKIYAYMVLFIWGGITGALYSITLALLSDKTSEDEAVVTNAVYSIMDMLGGVLGVLLIAVSMQIIGIDGLPYSIMFASILYFSYALTLYKVE